jgi:hypothetical protein
MLRFNRWSFLEDTGELVRLYKVLNSHESGVIRGDFLADRGPRTLDQDARFLVFRSSEEGFAVVAQMDADAAAQYFDDRGIPPWNSPAQAATRQLGQALRELSMAFGVSPKRLYESLDGLVAHLEEKRARCVHRSLARLQRRINMESPGNWTLYGVRHTLPELGLSPGCAILYVEDGQVPEITRAVVNPLEREQMELLRAISRDRDDDLPCLIRRTEGEDPDLLPLSVAIADRRRWGRFAPSSKSRWFVVRFLKQTRPASIIASSDAEAVERLLQDLR